MTKFQMPSFASVVRSAALAAALSVVAIISSPAPAVSLYWDNDANPVGNTVSNSGGTGLGVAGTWDTSSLKWWDGVSSDVAWTDGNDALFYGNASYTVTQSGNFAPNSLTFGVGTGNVIITGGTLTIGSPTNSIVMNTNKTGTARVQIIRSAISGTDITVVANAATGNVNSFLAIGANPTGMTNTFTGDLIFGGTFAAGATGLSQVAIENPTALPATATVRMKRTLSQLLFGGGGGGQTGSYTATFNNNIILNDGGSGTFTQGIGAFALGTVVTLNGVISGDANLILQLGNGGGQGKIILANHETYTGTTAITTAAAGTGIVALGINDVFPVATSFAVNRGNFDMAGFNQKVGGLSGSATGVISNTGGTTSTLTVSGNVNGDYAGFIGRTSSALLPGTTDNVALVLDSANTGSVTLSNTNGNTYDQGTTINGGKLYAGNTLASGGSATGSGAVAVNNGGTLGGNGSVAGAVTVASGGHITGGVRTGTNQIGTLTASSSLALSNGSNLDIDLGAPAPADGTSDKIDLPSGTATVAGVHSVAVNFGDPAGGAAGNGGYTLMTFPAGQFSGGTNTAFFTGTLPSSNSLNGATIAYHLVDGSNVNQDASPANATKVIAQVSGGPNALIWKGGVSGAWDTSALNFDNVGTGATGVAFAGNDNVTFGDTGANTNPIAVAGGGVQPNIVTINNSTTPYAFSGGDIKGSSLGGGGGLYLAGTGTVTIDNKYTAVGPITSNKTGAGAATFNGAITAATSLTVNGGAITLSSANTYSGNNIVNGGSITASGASATFGNGNITVNAGSAAIAAGVTNAILDSAVLTLLGGGTASTADAGFINLAAGINERSRLSVFRHHQLHQWHVRRCR